VTEDESDNDNGKSAQEPAISLDAHRGLRAQKETDRRRHRSGARADQDAVRASQASLEQQLFAGPATDWPQAAEKASYLLRLFSATGEGRDPRYKQLIEDVLRDLHRLAESTKEPRR
jgi:hypothetical protein